MTRTLKIFSSHRELESEMKRDASVMIGLGKTVAKSYALRTVSSEDEEIYYGLVSSLSANSYLGSQGFDKIGGLQKVTDIRTLQAVGALLRR